jgi:uncharacterized protein
MYYLAKKQSVLMTLTMAVFLLASALVQSEELKKSTSLKKPESLMNQVLESNEDLKKLLDNRTFIGEMQQLATTLKNHEQAKNNNEQQLRLYTFLGDYKKALGIVDVLQKDNRFQYFNYELYLKAKTEPASSTTFEHALEPVFTEIFASLDNRQASQAIYFTGWSLERGQSYLLWLFKQIQMHNSLDYDFAIRVFSEYQDYLVYDALFPRALDLVNKENARRYIIDDKVMIKTPDGALLSATVVRPRVEHPLPTAMQFTIYTDSGNLQTVIEAAARGYIGVVADARGKRLSPNAITPYETEVGDVNAVINWVTEQPWSDGRVAMYGGSYLGFAQWAATKHLDPALKTIVPIAAALPGQGLPMENNIFLNANYVWPFYVTNNKTLDTSINDDGQRWQNLNKLFYQKGQAYRDIDKIDGTPNYWLQRWLKHPAYDKFWQDMVPFHSDYKKINIPVLSITGYYDDGQISAIHYLSEHYKYNKNADHYLVIGPYDHRSAQGTQPPNLRGYQLDPVAHINVQDLTFGWFDYVLKGGVKPALIKNKINYQLMGSNSWRHVNSLESLHRHNKRFYLSNMLDDMKISTLGKKDRLQAIHYHKLDSNLPKDKKYLSQQVDFSDRSSENNQYYPWPIIKDQINIPNGLAFITEPFSQPMELSGRISGELKVKINKKDMDVGIVVYEVMADGKYFQLVYFLGRASYAKDMNKRQLLTPGKLESIPFERTRMTSRLLEKGSRLLVLVNVNKNSNAQINYGSGKDVSDETIEDSHEPLKIEWHNDSSINFPMHEYVQD